MSGKQPDNVSRRGFLRGLVITAAAATSVGGGAALLVNRHAAAPPIITTDPPPVPRVPAVEPVANTGAVTSDLMAELASAQADNVRLRSELDAALRRLEALQQANGDTGEANEILQADLAAASNRVGVLAGLVALYEQLEMDGVDLGAVVDGGLASFGGAFAELLERVPALEEGLAQGREALNEFEEQIPLVQQGRDWLGGHLARLGALYEAAENVLATVVDRAESFLQMLSAWFQDVLKWLPFGVGDKAADIVAALTELLAETPQTISGLQRHVVNPLDVWLDGEGEEVPLRHKLVKPLQERALAPAGEVASKVRQTQTTFQTDLADPTRTALERRHSIRQQIAAYREQHQV